MVEVEQPAAVNEKRAGQESVDHRKGPRRHGKALEYAILTAALDELSEVGYHALTMERVAARARTGKAALYRRWSSRAELVIDAAALFDIPEADFADTGMLRSDVLALLRQMSTRMASPLGGMLRGLLAEMTEDAAFAQLIRERVAAHDPAKIAVILRRAIERGEVESWVLRSRRANVAVDLLRNHFLMFGAPIADDVVVSIVDDVYLPLVLRDGRGDPAPEHSMAAPVCCGVT